MLNYLRNYYYYLIILINENIFEWIEKCIKYSSVYILFKLSDWLLCIIMIIITINIIYHHNI